MTPELQKALAEWLQATMGILQTVGAQIPPMLWEKVLWGRIVCTGELIVFIALCMVPFTMWKHSSQMSTDEEYDSFVPCSPRALYRFWAGCAAVVLGMMVLATAESALLVWVAPRVYLLNWLRSGM